MGREEKTILTNMCMVYDDCGNVLVEDRRNPEWSGITFPGGHVEHGESFVGSVIREVKEETGLDIAHPILCGIKQWYAEADIRYVVLFFKTSHFSGTIQSSGEGEVCWLPREELEHCRLAEGMDEMLKIFESDELTEFYFYTNEDGTWAHCKKRLKKERDLEAQGVSKSRLLLYSVVVQKQQKSKTSLAYLSAEVNQFLRLVGDVLKLIGDLSFQIKNGSLQGKHIRRGLALIHGARRPAAGVHHHEGH